MLRRSFNALAGAAWLGSGNTANAKEPLPPLERQFARSPFDVGTSAQLFVDRLLVRETQGIAFTMHEGTTHAAHPIMAASEPSEGWNVELFGSVLYDEDERLFKMWYVGEGAGLFPPGDYPTMYATAKDGLPLQKPLMGTIPDRNGSRRHNVVSLSDACGNLHTLHSAIQALKPGWRLCGTVRTVSTRAGNFLSRSMPTREATCSSSTVKACRTVPYSAKSQPPRLCERALRALLRTATFAISTASAR